tara:strand:+ start:69 stop:632 length:564 start_codon:yes stop_codon:yes gene_type:complete
MICEVFDDWLDKRFIYELTQKITTDITDINFINIANRRTWPYGDEGSHRMMGCTLFQRENLNRITILNKEASFFFDIFESIEKMLNIEYYLGAIELNIQHSGCNGTSHIDGSQNEQTIMLMSNPEWDSKWGGQFQMLNNDGSVAEEHDYVPGRLIIFPSHIPHRGLGPSEKYPYIYRHTVVFRVRTF